MTTLLERIRVLGGNDGGQTQELPILDTSPGDGPELEADPAPGEATRTKKTARAAAKSQASSATAAKQTRTGGKFVSRSAVQKTMADELDTMLKMLAFTWSLSDEHCAGVLNETSSRIAADLSGLLSRSQWIVERFDGASLLADVIKGLTTITPLVRAVWAHHGPAARLARQEEEDGLYEPVVVADPGPGGYAPWRPNAGSTAPSFGVG